MVVTRAHMEGRVAVVTGGAGGIGSAISRALAEAGAQVIVTYRCSEEAAHALVGCLPGNGHMAVRAPVEDSAVLAEVAADVEERYGRLDLLVNNAGITRFVPHDDLDALDDDLIDKIFQVNWRGPFACIRAFRQLLERSDDGLVVNVSSVAGVTGIGSNVAYCASKAALNAMTVSIARALAPRIRVVSVSPGLVDTEFVRGLDDQWREDQLAKTPLNRLAKPEDVAATVLALATTMTYTTGCVIPLDGGRPLT